MPAVLALVAWTAGCGSGTKDGEAAVAMPGQQSLLSAADLSGSPLHSSAAGVFTCGDEGCPAMASEDAALAAELRPDLPGRADVLCRPLVQGQGRSWRGRWAAYPLEGRRLSLPLSTGGLSSGLSHIGPGKTFSVECVTAEKGILHQSVISLNAVLRPPRPEAAVIAVPGGGREAFLAAPSNVGMAVAWRLLPTGSAAALSEMAWSPLSAGQTAFRIPLPPGHRIVYWWAPVSLGCLPAGFRTCAMEQATADMLWVTQGELQ